MLASMLVLTSCFKDEGNYDYDEMNPPHWLYDQNSPSVIYARAGEEAVFDAGKLFVWDNDSAQREKEVRYEWILNGKVVGEGKTFKVASADLMKAADVKEYTSSGSGGTPGVCAVIEKNTGVKYMGCIQVYFTEKYTSDNWFVLTERNAETAIAALCKKIVTENGVKKENYEVTPDAYAEANEGKKIPGRPVSMNWAYDKHVGSQGSITVITDQGGYELSASDMSLYSQINGEQFLDGPPADFSLVARADCDADGMSVPATFLAGADGRIFSRVMSKNYLGGKYLTEPYFVDEKGYKVTRFGNTLYGTRMIPCYDEKNRRIMIASVNTRQEVVDGEYIMLSTTSLKPLLQPSPKVSVQAMPEGTEVLYLGVTNHVPNYTRGCIHYTMVYNLPGEAHTRVSDFSVYVATSTTNTSDNFSSSFLLENAPKLSASSKILSSGATQRGSYPGTAFSGKVLYYSVNNELYYVHRTPVAGKPQQHELKKFEMPEGVSITSPISCLALSPLYCDELLVGCENGDLFIINVNVLDDPELVYQCNLGGKVMAAQQLGGRAPSADRFNN